MTTTPTASPDVPDLDKLEALARAATAGSWLYRRDPGNLIGAQHCVKLAGENGAWVCDCIDNADRSTVGGIAGERNAAFIAGANPAAVLALIALARRAQPEGEAPQADLEQLNGGMHDSIFVKVWGDAGGGDAGRRKLADYAYALGKRASISLSPLCGAQHAESGKEAEQELRSQMAFIAAYDPNELDGGDSQEGMRAADRLACIIRRARKTLDVCDALAAQQAAVPGAVEGRLVSVDVSTGDNDYANRIFAELTGETGSDGTTLIAIEKSRNFSAPGTPEAPQPPFPISDDEMAALRRFWECATDGEGYDVEKAMMQRLAEMGLVQRKSGAYYMATDFGLYVLGEYTIQRAAQLDGGQEGSAT